MGSVSISAVFRALRFVWVRADLSRSAAALSYYLILSLFPFLLCIHCAVGPSGLQPESLLRPLESFLPPVALTLLEDYLTYVSSQASPSLFWAGLTAIFLSASAALRTVLQVMDILYREGRPLPGRFFSGFFLSALFLPTVYLSVAVVLTGDWFFRFLARHLPAAPQGLHVVFGLWNWLRYLLLFGCVLLLVSVLYRAGIPRSAAGHRAVFGAALSTALVMALSSALFSRFISLSARYPLVYGSLAGLILLLVWLYFCGHILLLGAAALYIAAHLRSG